MFKPYLIKNTTYPLDGLSVGESASVARQLSKNHKKAFKVRRSSDNTTLDIGFKSNGELDTATLLSFCGAGSGYVQKLYGVNGSEFANDNTGKEPRIVNSGVVDIDGGKPCMVFDGANDALWCSNNANIDITNQPLYLAQILSIDASVNTDAYLIVKNTDSGLSSAQYALYFLNAGSRSYVVIEGAVRVTSTANSIIKGKQHILSSVYINNNINVNIDAIYNASAALSTSMTNKNYLTLAARQSTSNTQTGFLKGKMAEFHILKGNPKQTDFETKAKKYYSIA